ncbi:hypothetical protein DITRI_Ditri15bG0024200 [Diplodiscus trichospermus]
MVASARKRSNWINQIVVQGNSLSEPKEIKEDVAAHFENHFNKRKAIELVELNCSLKKLEESSNNDLERPFSCGEILEAVNDCGRSKAPGPDGLNLDFIRSNWSLFQADFMDFFEHFYKTGSFDGKINNSFISLIPKCENPVELKEYRPISLMGCVYKVLAKVLSRRLRKVMGQQILMEWANFIYCQVDVLPTNYLGLPLGARANAQEVWRPLIDKFYKQLSGWKSEKLSIGGRSNICNSIDNGRLGIVDLKLKNRALMNRWIWRFGVEKDALWRKVVDAKYDGSEYDLLPNVLNYRNFSSMWKNITKPLMYNDEFTNTFVSSMGFSLGNGGMIKFWDVEWISGCILKLSFPHIFALAMNKDGRVKDYGRFVNNEWRWEIALRRGLFGWETQQWNDFYGLIREYEVCTNFDDKLIWKGSPSGSYSVKQFCKDHLNELMRGRVAVKSNVAKRGLMQWSEALCPFCRLEVESPEHLFISCAVVGLKPFQKQHVTRCGKWFFFAIVWTIWLTRNDVVFNDKSVSIEQVIDSSKLRLVHWVKAKWLRILTGWQEIFMFLNLIVVPLKGHKIRSSISWVSPNVGELKFNVDGSALGKPGPTGIGGILRDHLGIKKMAFSKPTGIADSNIAELMAIREAFILFISLPWCSTHKLIIESDSTNAVKWVLNTRTFHGE